jgi:hypothetical protein
MSEYKDLMFKTLERALSIFFRQNIYGESSILATLGVSRNNVMYNDDDLRRPFLSLP